MDPINYAVIGIFGYADLLDLLDRGSFVLKPIHDSGITEFVFSSCASFLEIGSVRDWVGRSAGRVKHVDSRRRIATVIVGDKYIDSQRAHHATKE